MSWSVFSYREVGRSSKLKIWVAIGTISRLDGGQNLREQGPDSGRSVADEDVEMPNIEEFDEDSVTFKVDSQGRFQA